MLRIRAAVRLLATLTLAALAHAANSNTVTFDNHSGAPALVKMVGPTRGSLPVPDLSRASIRVAPGRYYILRL
jgi:hypothetical protein